jgi:hypothetical protein
VSKHISDTELGTAFDVMSKFVAASEAQRVIATVWAAGTHVYRAFAIYPRIYLTADGPQSGKSTFMEIITEMSFNPLVVDYSSQAAVYAWLDQHPDTTLGLDEADQIFGSDGRKTSRSVLLAVLNGGYAKRGKVLVVRGGKAVKMPVYNPVAMAGFGTLPEALLSRCATIHLERGVPQEQYISEVYAEDLEGIGQDLHDWITTKDARKSFADADTMADVDGDPRFRQIMAPLQAIADYAGCGEQFRAALVEVSTGIKDKVPETRSQMMIHDLRECWNALDPVPSIMSAREIISLLHNHDSRRWNKLSNTTIGAMILSDWMKTEGIGSAVRFGERGYTYRDVFRSGAKNGE